MLLSRKYPEKVIDNGLQKALSVPQKMALKESQKKRFFLKLWIKAKVPPSPNQRPEKRIKGMRKCGEGCTACPFIFEHKNINISNKEKWYINRKHNCKS